MARAIARGLGEPVLASDGGSGRAAELVAELGGEVVSNAELVERADLVLLAHKPYQLATVAEGMPRAKGVVSVLGGTTLAELRAAWPGAPVARTMPNTAVEVRAGVTCVAEGGDLDVAELFGRIGRVVTLPEAQIDVASAVMGVAPAYYAVIAEAWTDAAVRRGLRAPVAGELVAAAMEGSARLLAARDMDTLAVRREVTSPGGTTARGLAALERHGLRAALDDAMEAVLTR
jgi:pyrroline-5-carboxylate reductase